MRASQSGERRPPSIVRASKASFASRRRGLRERRDGWDGRGFDSLRAVRRASMESTHPREKNVDGDDVGRKEGLDGVAAAGRGGFADAAVVGEESLGAAVGEGVEVRGTE